MNETNYVSEINGYKIKDSEIRNYFNINNFTNIESSDMTPSNPSVTIDSGSYFTLATNEDSTLFKLYGKADINVTGVTGDVTLSFSTSLRPSTAININGACLMILYDNTNRLFSIQSTPLQIATDGTCTIRIYTGANYILNSALMLPCLYFLKDFGD